MDLEAMLGIGIAAVVGLSIFAIALAVLSIIINWRIFEKAGRPGWECIIPIYNVIVFLRISGKPVWWFFMLLIPIVNIVFAIRALHSFSKSFGKDAGFTVGLIFLGLIFRAILAFGSAQYVGPGGVPAGAEDVLDHGV